MLYCEYDLKITEFLLHAFGVKHMYFTIIFSHMIGIL